MILWDHQQTAIDETLAAIAGGQRRVLLTAPTGAGKTLIAIELIRKWIAGGLRVVLYTNRRLLVDQLSRVLEEQGITHGVRAAGYDDELHLDVQISSIQTEGSRVLKKETWNLHPAQRVLVDEAHLQKEKTAQAILSRHTQDGAAVVGMTATPIDLGGLYDHLIVAGTTSQLRRCGALVAADHYGPDEPDLRHIGPKLLSGQDPTEKENREAILRPGVFGRVFENWQRLNPDARPTILFGPDVAGSLWFAEQFWRKGVPSAHVDGEEVWVNGKSYRRTRNNDPANDILEGSRNGEITVLCNRFVLREGIDAPWLAHGILATVFGSLQSYLQSGGRLLRSHPRLEAVTVQDHGGNWHRFGSLNADRQWKLTDTARGLVNSRVERLRDKKEPEPIRCPECNRILSRFKCVCGYEIPSGKRSRPVIQADGTLKTVSGDIYRPRKTESKPDTLKLWQREYYRALHSRKTFSQAAGWFFHQHGYWPPRNLPLMPQSNEDWGRKVCDVERERLR